MFLCQLKTIHLPNGLVSLYLKDNIVELVRKDLVTCVKYYDY